MIDSLDSAVPLGRPSEGGKEEFWIKGDKPEEDDKDTELGIRAGSLMAVELWGELEGNLMVRDRLG